MTSSDPSDLFARPEPEPRPTTPEPAPGPPAPGPAGPGPAATGPAPASAAPQPAPASVVPAGQSSGHAASGRPSSWDARPTAQYPTHLVHPTPSTSDTAPQGAARRPRARLGAGRTVAVALLALALGFVGGLVGFNVADGEDDARLADADLPVAVDDTDGGADSRPAGSVAAIAADVLPSVVSLEIYGDDGTGSSGSGFVLREDGYVLTNNHVVAGAVGGGEIVVVLADGSQHDGEIVGRTTDYDLAVVKIDTDGLEPLVLGDSDDVVVGDAVLAVGAPLGLDATVTSGIVSALHRPVQAGDQATTAFIDAIQTDAAINPGNSGGPLVNADGEVVGINSAIAQPPGSMQATGSIGLGFAIPANQARTTAEQLIETGTATYPVIGVLLDGSYTGEGVKVSEEPQDGVPAVTPDGPADLAGVRPGDVILEIDGRPVSRSDELIVAIRALQPGDAVTLRIRTGEDERDVRVVLQESASE
ncbi:S1C family serine protease [Isoptericola jiangsuensis]|uniref:S1C family serine protease n=1 Tax=Isoptericola jiangsuensis TaxID=548579 RepID=UPI003AAD1E0E